MAARIITIVGVFAMGCVVAHHVPASTNDGILKFGVPWFFFASGFWMGGKFIGCYGNAASVWKQECARRVRTLIVPYFLWNLIWFPILFAANWIGWRYCWVERVVDGSFDCVIRCLGFSVWQWPALVPTWFLRSLFVASVIVGAVWVGFSKCGKGLRFAWIVRTATAAVIFWAIEFILGKYGPDGEWWDSFLCFGIPVYGMACFASGGLLSAIVKAQSKSSNRIIACVRRQMMPVFLLHVPVILFISWTARAVGRADIFADTFVNVIIGIAGISGAIVIGEVMRAFIPRMTGILFGGR